MLKLSSRPQIAIGTLLVALMIATRGHHFSTVQNVLPTASWAAFFLAGVYLRPAWFPALLLGLAAFLDYAAIQWGGVSSYCVSAAYVALIPAYLSLWAAGRLYANRYAFAPLPFALFAVAGTVVCEIISSGSFYFFSARFAEPTLAEFAGRLLKYGPHSLASVAFWAAAALLAHGAVLLSHRRSAR